MTRQTFQDRVRWPEGYFLYYEDVQLCVDARRAGLDIVVLDEVLVEHQWKRDSVAMLSQATRNHVKSAIKFYSRNPLIAIGLTGLL